MKETSNNEILSGDISAKILGIGSEIKAEKAKGIIQSAATEEFIKTIQEKVIHDYSFDKVFEYIKTNNMIKSDKLLIGDFVHTIEKITILDFNYFSSLFDEGGAVKYTNDESKKKLQDLKNSIPNGQKVTPEIKASIKAITDTTNSAEEERKSTLKTIEMIRNTIPYKRFLQTERFLVPLDDGCFRDNPEIMAFKYGGSISVLGCVTNIINKETNVEGSNAFSQMYNIVNSTLLSLFEKKDVAYIVHPIAMYY